MGSLTKKEFYENMGIYNLRNYARCVGVRSASNKNKGEIIDLILKIERGELEPYNNFKLSKGRPPKSGIKLHVNMNEQQLELANKKLKNILHHIYEIVRDFEF